MVIEDEVLISVSPKLGYKAYYEISRILEITELHNLSGGFDLIARIEAEDYQKLGNILVNKIKSIDGVLDVMKLNEKSF
ncbi:MAG: Lrp/AsnC ligand binding domain-containing protein [Thermoplasmatales archaeon]|nr:MAG: Lrp/AsnC ligand binding domain-containing protein [Thermoplasmatales archaeon]